MSNSRMTTTPNAAAHKASHSKSNATALSSAAIISAAAAVPSLKQLLLTETMRQQQQPRKPKFQVQAKVNTNLRRHPDPPAAKPKTPEPQPQPQVVHAHARPVSLGADFLSVDELRRIDARKEINEQKVAQRATVTSAEQQLGAGPQPTPSKQLAHVEQATTEKKQQLAKEKKEPKETQRKVKDVAVEAETAVTPKVERDSSPVTARMNPLCRLQPAVKQRRLAQPSKLFHPKQPIKIYHKSVGLNAKPLPRKRKLQPEPLPKPAEAVKKATSLECGPLPAKRAKKLRGKLLQEHLSRLAKPKKLPRQEEPLKTEKPLVEKDMQAKAVNHTVQQVSAKPSTERGMLPITKAKQLHGNLLKQHMTRFTATAKLLPVKEKPSQKDPRQIKLKLKAEKRKIKIAQLRKETKVFDIPNVEVTVLHPTLWRKRLELCYRELFDGDSDDDDVAYASKIKAARNYMVQKFGSYKCPTRFIPGHCIGKLISQSATKFEVPGKAVPRVVIALMKQAKLMSGGGDTANSEPNVEISDDMRKFLMENFNLREEDQTNGMQNMGGGDGTSR